MGLHRHFYFAVKFVQPGLFMCVPVVVAVSVPGRQAQLIGSFVGTDVFCRDFHGYNYGCLYLAGQTKNNHNVFVTGKQGALWN
jgi:hypothetical protein